MRSILQEAAQSKTYYPNTKVATQVATYLSKNSSRLDFNNVNLRTLQLGYELAVNHPKSWRDLFDPLLPKGQPKVVAVKISKTLARSGLKVKVQQAEFQATTGMSRRTFYNYRKRLGLSKGADVSATGYRPR